MRRMTNAMMNWMYMPMCMCSTRHAQTCGTSRFPE